MAEKCRTPAVLHRPLRKPVDIDVLLEAIACFSEK